MSTAHWPCPHGCMNWARIGGEMTNHHPRCEFVNESLIDVWKVSDGCTHYYTDREADAYQDKSMIVTKEKMHREIYNNLPEFQGF